VVPLPRTGEAYVDAELAAEISMSAACVECGAPLPPGGACIDYFHELLALESRIPGGAGERPHFLAVAAYNLQHPSGFTPAMLRGLRRTFADVLDGRASVDDAWQRARYAADGPTRVRRRSGDALSDDDRAMLAAWPSAWGATVLDACRARPEEYADRVQRWAAAVSAQLRDIARTEDGEQRGSHPAVTPRVDPGRGRST
jgi:hypothetical protein